MKNVISSIYDQAEPVLSPQEEIDLARRAQKGCQQALDQMVRANLRLVVYVVKSLPFWQKNERGLTFEDLIQFGNIYLIKAIREWKPISNIRFATFARQVITMWVRREFEKYNATIYIPLKKQESLRKLAHIQNTNPSVPLSELAKLMKLSIKELQKLLDLQSQIVVSYDSLEFDNKISEIDNNE